MGLPMETDPFVISVSTLQAADQIVVSVGPYRFQSDAHRFNNWFASSRSRASPPHRILSRSLPSQPASSSSLHVAGVACITVAPEFANCSDNLAPSAATSRLTSARCAPTLSGRNTSSAAISNDKVVTESSTSCSTSPGSRRIDVKKLTTARCGICTPLDFPVDPEV